MVRDRLSVSDNFRRIHGIDKDILRPGDILALVHADDLPDVRRKLSAAMLRGGSFASEHRTVRKDDGRVRMLTVRGEIVRDGDGKAVRMLGVSQDVTDLIHGENRLGELEARLERMLDASPTAIYSCVPWGEYRANYVSPSVKEVLGYSPEEFTSDPAFWTSRIHPEDTWGLFEILSTLQEFTVISIEYRFLHADGSWRWVRDRCSLILGSDGRPVGLAGCWEDVTDRRQAEEALRRSRTLLEEAGKPAELGCLQKDLVTGEVFCSESLLRIIGLEPGGPGPSMERILERVHPEDRRKFRGLSGIRLSRRTGHTLECRVLRPDGRIVHVRIKGETEVDAEGTPVRFHCIVQATGGVPEDAG